MSILKKLWIYRLLLRSILSTLYFNFRYLPLKKAICLPIWLYKPKLLKTKGRIVLDIEKIKPGIVRLGFPTVSLYPNTGVTWENHGGTVLFKGTCRIGNSSALSIGPNGHVEFGDLFAASAAFRLTSYCSISFEDFVRVGWECLVIDSSFHSMKNMEGEKVGKPFSPIYIGKNSWITTRCTILKGAKLPAFCTVATGSIVNKDYSNLPSYILLAGNPLTVKTKGIWRDVYDDGI